MITAGSERWWAPIWVSGEPAQIWVSGEPAQIWVSGEPAQIWVSILASVSAVASGGWASTVSRSMVRA